MRRVQPKRSYDYAWKLGRRHANTVNVDRIAKVMRLPNGLIIAVVDDDDAVRESISELLEVYELECRCFNRAEAFLAAHARGEFGCLITDVRMPGVSGIELQQRMQALDPGMPIIVTTSSTDSTTLKRALEAGAFVILTKPVKEHILIKYLTLSLGRINSTRTSDRGLSLSDD